MTRLAFSDEIWKRDRRIKKGTRKVETIDYVDLTKEEVQAKMGKLFPAAKGYEVKIFDTYVTYVNRQTGREFQERYDTPMHCNPAFESFWSM
jgi:hypothetical protein